MSRILPSSDPSSNYGDSTFAVTALLAALARLNGSAEPAAVFAEAIRRCAPGAWDAAAVELIDDAGQRQLLEWPPIRSAGAVLDGLPVTVATIIGDIVYTPILPAEGDEGPAFRGVLALRFDGIQAGPREALIGQLVVDRVVSLIHRERLLAQARDERTRATHLERALESSREIGTALGILMANQKCRTDEAFEQLRQASQTSHRKVREIALDIIDTGVLDVRT